MVKITKIFILVSLVIILLYDVYAVIKGGTEATISWIVAGWAYDYPSLPFAVGFVCGHLFWQMKAKQKGLKSNE